MDRKKHYLRGADAVRHAFDKAKVTVKISSEKSGDVGTAADLLLEKMSLERQLAKRFLLLGNRFYETGLRENPKAVWADEKIAALVEEIQRLELELARVMTALEQERRDSRSAHKHKLV